MVTFALASQLGKHRRGEGRGSVMEACIITGSTSTTMAQGPLGSWYEGNQSSAQLLTMINCGFGSVDSPRGAPITYVVQSSRYLGQGKLPNSLSS